MKTYNKNGVETEIDYILSDNDEFAIQVEENSVQRQIFYKNDTLVRDIENYLIELYDIFRDLYFENTEEYYANSSIIPAFIHLGGYSSDFTKNTDFFFLKFIINVKQAGKFPI